MKMVMAFIRNDRLRSAQEALGKIGITAYTVSATIGVGEHGRQASQEGQPELLQHLRIEVAVRDHWEDQVVEALIRAGRSGEQSQGIILVYDIARAVKIRTGEEGDNILFT